MKQVLLLLFLFFTVLTLPAQQVKISLNSESKSIRLYNKIKLDAYFTNTGSETVRIFRNHLTSFGGVSQTWTIKRDGEVIKTFKGHAQDTNTGYRPSNFKDLRPGQSYRFALYLLDLEEPGDYEVSYQLRQTPGAVNPKWAENGEAKKLAEGITKLNVVDTYKFTVEPLEVKPFTLQEPNYKQLRNKIKNFELAKSDPSNAFNLVFSPNQPDTDYTDDWVALSGMKNLRILEIDLGEVDAVLPEKLGDIPLTTLKISGRGGIVSFPAEFLRAGSLTVLELYGLALKDMPDFVYRQKNLTKLTVVDCGLKLIPEELTELKELKKLDLSRNEITQIPPALQGLSALEEVKLNQTEIEVLENIFGSTNLRKIEVKKSALKSVSPDIGKLKSCSEINLSDNTLITLPLELFDIPNLRSINAGNNQIKYLPEGVQRAEGLVTFDLKNNKLISLPDDFTSIPKLKHVQLQGNPLEKSLLIKNLKRIMKLRKGTLKID